MEGVSKHLQFWLNGKEQCVKKSGASENLLDYLREQGLTGCKRSCGIGECGSCTVVVRYREEEGGAVVACLVPLASLQGAAVTTVEGLGQELHPVQEMLHVGHATQCGFCSPGVVMSAVGLLSSCPNPDIEDLGRGLQGNLCRCTGYRPILSSLANLCSKTERELDRPEALSLNREAERLRAEVECTELELESTEQVWHRPVSLARLFVLLDQHPDSVLKSGGTGGLHPAQGRQEPAGGRVVELRGIVEMHEVEETEEGLWVGAAVSLSRLEKLLRERPGMTTLLKSVQAIGTPQVRNLATVGGHLCWGHPASDLLPCLILLGSRVKMASSKGIKEKNLDLDVYRGRLTDKNEVVTALFIPNSFGTLSYYRQARRKAGDLAVANMAIQTKEDGTVRIIVGGTGGVSDNPPSAKEAIKTSSILNSTPFSLLPRSSLLDAIFEDLGADCGRWRTTLVVGFLDAWGHGERESRLSYQQFSSSQVWEVSDNETESSPLHLPLPHEAGKEQLQGTALYVDDLPKMVREVGLYPVLSRLAHANFEVDVSAALRVPGVVGWISASDIQGTNLWSIAGIPDEEVFPSKEVVHVGQIIGVIAAESVEAGSQGVDLVRVSYSSLPAILSTGAALKEKSWHGGKRSLERHQGGQQDAEIVGSVEGKVEMGGQEHFYWEPHTALVIPGERSELVVHYTTQEPGNVQQQVCMVLGLPQHKVTVRCKRTGGGFGGKERCFPALMAAIAAVTLKRPARFVLTREVDTSTTGHRHEASANYQLSFNSSGKLLSAGFDLAVNAGCSSDLSVTWVDTLIKRIDGGYTLVNFTGTGFALKTNMVSNTAMRGFGSPEGALIIEEGMESIARALKKDPALVRRENLTRQGDLLHHGSKTVPDDHLLACWEECVQQSNYWEARKEVEQFNETNPTKKRGLAIVPVKFFPTIPVRMLNQAGAFVRVFVDGTVLLSHGGIEMGQGLHTKMLQVAAKELGVDMAKIYIADTNTDTVPNATATGGSTGTDLNGAAVMNACRQIAQHLRPLRESSPKASWEEIIGKAYQTRTQLAAFGFYNTSPLDYDDKTNTGSVFNYLTNGVGCSLVELNCLTGDYQLLRTDIVMDVGRSLNPAIDVGQIEGAFVQGLGYVTMEEMVHGPDGEILNKNLGEYKIPTLADMPMELRVSLLRGARTDEESVYSSKGIGEPPLSLAVSVVCALREAVAAYRKSELPPLKIPLTVERLRMACEDDIVRGVQTLPEKKRIDVLC